MAIKCFVPECTEDVIGQCAGLGNEPCGHFYCSKHSRGKLCGECVAVQNEIDLIQKYVDAAAWVSKPLGCGWAILLSYIAIPGLILFLYQRWFQGVACFTLSSIVVAIILRLRSKRRLQRKCKDLDNFEEFYRMYKKYKNKEQARSMLIGTMQFASYMLSPEYSTASEIRRIRKRLE